MHLRDPGVRSVIDSIPAKDVVAVATIDANRRFEPREKIVFTNNELVVTLTAVNFQGPREIAGNDVSVVALSSQHLTILHVGHGDVDLVERPHQVRIDEPERIGLIETIVDDQRVIAQAAIEVDRDSGAIESIVSVSSPWPPTRSYRRCPTRERKLSNGQCVVGDAVLIDVLIRSAGVGRRDPNDIRLVWIGVGAKKLHDQILVER